MKIAKYVSSIFLFIIVTLLSIKMFDILVGEVYYNERQASNWGGRYINLREIPPNTDSIFSPADGYIIKTNGLVKNDFRIRTNEDGFIVGPGDIQGMRAHGDRPIDFIFFGGSTTESMYVDEEYRFPYLVGKSINKKNGEPLVVLNGGYSGNHSLHSFLSNMVKGVSKKPDFVVLMNVVNDVALLSKTGSYWKAPSSRSIVKIMKNGTSKGGLYDVLSSIKDYLIPNFWPIVRPLFIGYVNNKIAMDEWHSFRGEKKSYQDMRKILEYEYRASIGSFVTASKEWGIEPILMTQFNRFRLGDKYSKKSYLSKDQPLSYIDFVNLYKTANNIIRDVAKEKNILLIDLDKELIDLERYLYDTVHLNTDGSKKVANIIIEKLTNKYPNLLLDN
jgi:hypothetical protein